AGPVRLPQAGLHARGARPVFDRGAARIRLRRPQGAPALGDRFFRPHGRGYAGLHQHRTGPLGTGGRRRNRRGILHGRLRYKVGRRSYNFSMAEITKLGRYQLKGVLGRGAMGVVYEGLDPALNRRVAIKTILKNAAIDAETAQMYSAQFAREAQAAGRLSHPNLVGVHDFAEEGEIAYLVMEYIQGRELRSFFEAKEMFALPEAVRIMCELLEALDFAHEAGVIHRDVKPANVMLDAQRRV